MLASLIVSLSMSYTLLRASDRSLAGTGLRHTSGRIVNGLSESKFSFGDGGETFTISEISDYEEGCGIGRNIWEASVALSCFLASYSESMGRTLEIGAGVGLVGHSIASNSSKARVVMTDHFAPLVDNLASSLLRNDLKATTALLDWREPELADAVASGSFDTVVGADVIYYYPDVKPIAAILQHLLAEAGGTAWIASPDYRAAEIGQALAATLRDKHGAIVDEEKYILVSEVGEIGDEVEQTETDKEDAIVHRMDFFGGAGNDSGGGEPEAGHSIFRVRFPAVAKG
ncbi:hypothetical protein TrVE_jg12296 [Triparma verrucosa]|uniref:Uncharacterized protein n=1 Tax=Triparma verrucosa TaxID=1606542 RepID=A0A9W7BIQ9_9STRA|nr:hypothetical protein TrVE_jg12296 [Triparma verrucosa]